MACGFTWWIINRLRRILLSVNQGDAFEFANVKRLQGVGLGLIGIQLTALLLALILPCQCMAPHIPEQDVYTPLPQAAAVAYLDDSVVVYDEAA